MTKAEMIAEIFLLLLQDKKAGETVASESPTGENQTDEADSHNDYSMAGANHDVISG